MQPLAVQVEVPPAAELVEEVVVPLAAAVAAAWVAADFADDGHFFQTVHADPSSGVAELWGLGRMDCCYVHCHLEWRQHASLGPASFSFQPRFLPWR